MLSPFVLSNVLLFSLAGQTALPPPPPEIFEEEPLPPPRDPDLLEKEPPQAQSSFDEGARARAAAAADDDDLPLRIVGGLCGGMLGLYLGQMASPLLTIPVMVLGIGGMVLFGSALLPFLTGPVGPFVMPCAFGGLSLIGFVLPITGAIVVAKLGYDNAPAIVGSAGRRFSDGPPPPSGPQSMAY